MSLSSLSVIIHILESNYSKILNGKVTSITSPLKQIKLRLTKRSLDKCSQEVKAEAYTTLVRPKLEYSSAVCDSYRKYQINKMEKIQHRAARFVLDGFSRESSVTSTLVFHKAIHHKIAVPLPDYLKTSTHHTRLSDCCYFIPQQYNRVSFHGQLQTGIP